MLIQLTEAEQAILQRLANSGKTEQRLVRRAQIVLTLAQQIPVVTTAERLQVTPKTVRKWRDRYDHAAEQLAQAQTLDQPEAAPPLATLIKEVLNDGPRSGKPADFTPEQITQVVALSCEPPAESGRPISQWTQRELAREAEKRGIVETISHRSVGRFLKRGRPQTPSVAVLAQ